MRLLLVEDDEGVREGLADVLGYHGDVNAVGDLLEARRLLSEGSFDLIVADLRIGGDRSGGKKIVGAARERGVPVVIVSGSSREEIDRALGEDRADGILTKPFLLEDFERLIARFKRS